MLLWSPQNHPVDQATPSDDYFEVCGNFGVSVYTNRADYPMCNTKPRPITAYYKFSFSSPEPHGGGRSGTLLGVGYVLDIAV